MGDALRTPVTAKASRFVRNSLTWHLYLLFGFFQLIVNLQGNIFPFLKVELGTSYRTIGLHPTAFACGFIAVGLFGPGIIRRFGRRRMLVSGVLGFAIGAMVLCLAWMVPVSIASFTLLGIFGAFIATTVFSTLADIHGELRAIAFNEAAATASIFVVFASPLTGICIYLGLGWRGAVLVSVAFGIAVLASFVRISAPEPVADGRSSGGTLSPAYWAYSTALALGIATEFCVFVLGADVS